MLEPSSSEDEADGLTPSSSTTVNRCSGKKVIEKQQPAAAGVASVASTGNTCLSAAGVSSATDPQVPYSTPSLTSSSSSSCYNKSPGQATVSSSTVNKDLQSPNNTGSTLTSTTLTRTSPNSSTTNNSSIEPVKLSTSDQQLLSISGRTSVGSNSTTTNRPVSPSPSLLSDPNSKLTVNTDTEIDLEKEETERKTRLQLYVFVIRCISYSFNAKQPNDITKRPFKVTKSQFDAMLHRLESACSKAAAAAVASASSNSATGTSSTATTSASSTAAGQLDDIFLSILSEYLEIYLSDERIAYLIHSGSCSNNDFREIFRGLIRRRIKSLPDDILQPPESNAVSSSKESLMSTWMAKFECLLKGDPESDLHLLKKPTPRHQMIQANLTAVENILTKDQLYDMFQGILRIKKFEHQLLFK